MLQKSVNFETKQEPQEKMVKLRVGMVIRTIKKSDQKWTVSCEKWDGPKVSWKFIDPPRYDGGLMIKGSVSMFLVHLF